MIKNIKSTTDLSALYVVFNGSVQNETYGWFGISHLLEHLVCKSFEHLHDDFQRYGIKWNAYTTNTNIVFYMEGLDEYIEKYSDEFINSITTYNIDEVSLEKEKKIVLEEYNDVFNDQLSSHYINLFRKKYNVCMPIGLKEDIENVSIDDCRAYIYLFLRTPSMIINVSKNREYKLNKIFSSNKFSSNKFSSNKTNNHKIESFELNNNFNTKESIILYSDPITKDHNKYMFLCDLISNGLNSPLFKEVREKYGYVYSIDAFVLQIDENTSHLLIATQTNQKNTERVIEEINNVLQKKINQERFNVVKDYLNVSYKIDEILIHQNVEDHFINPNFLVKSIINDISLEEINDILKNLKLNSSIFSKEFEK